MFRVLIGLILVLLFGCAKSDYYNASPTYGAEEDIMLGEVAVESSRSSTRARKSSNRRAEPAIAMDEEQWMDDAPTPDSVEEEPASAQPQRMVHYNGYLHLRVTDPEESIDGFVTVAQEAGGFIESRTDSRVTMRVPVDRFEATYETLLGRGDVLERSVTAEDVTEAFTAVDLRLQTLKTTHDRLVELLARAKTEEEKLALLQQIQRVSEEIDVVEGQMRTLSSLASFSRITVQTSARSAFSDRPATQDAAGIGWIARLSPFRRDVGDDKRVALAEPEGMVVLSPRGRFIAESADGAVVWTARFRNDPRGEASFWINAVEERLAPQFADAAISEVGSFQMIRFVEEGGYRYLIGVRDAGKWVEVVQVYYPAQDHEDRYGDAVMNAIRGGQS
ncbi:MAG: DUF4349 domain-containing protein [Myxococcota bacterium]